MELDKNDIWRLLYKQNTGPWNFWRLHLLSIGYAGVYFCPSFFLKNLINENVVSFLKYPVRKS